jgi:hypothetical protein
MKSAPREDPRQDIPGAGDALTVLTADSDRKVD